MIEDIRTVSLPKAEDERGNLSYIEGLQHIPFRPQRAYWIYDVPGGEVRGSHAYRRAQEFIVALSGSFDVTLEDKNGNRRQISLNRSYNGVYVPAQTWRTLENFSTNALGLILSSTPYEEDDYVWQKSELETLPAPIAETLPEPQLPEDKCRWGVDDCKVIELPALTELRRGYLTAVNEMSADLPFPLRRIFYIYDIPSGSIRGAHAHYKAWQAIVAASSSFEVVVDDGEKTRTFRLDRPYRMLLVPPGIWCHLHDFASASVALVLTSEYFSKEDYISSWPEFLDYKRHQG